MKKKQTFALEYNYCALVDITIDWSIDELATRSAIRDMIAFYAGESVNDLTEEELLHQWLGDVGVFICREGHAPNAYGHDEGFYTDLGKLGITFEKVGITFSRDDIDIAEI
jgi:hypothetical protein